MRSSLHPYAIETVVPELNGITGLTLSAVTYRTLHYEADEEHIAEPDFYLGGDVELNFSSSRSLFVSWDQRVPYGHDFAFGLLLSSEKVFGDNAVTPYDATNIPLWRNHVGRRINHLRLFGYFGAPFVLGLTTDIGDVFLGSSSRTHFGDGDDVYITNDISDADPQLHLVWPLQPKNG